MRILIVDDDPAMHDFYRRGFATAAETAAAPSGDAGAEVEPAPDDVPMFELTHCRQSLDAVAAVQAAVGRGEPYPVAFIDARMSSGIDGRETARRLRLADPDINIVVVMGSSDVSPLEIGRAADPAGKVAIARRCLVGLVNAGRTDLARQVQARHDLHAASLEAWQPGKTLDAGERDALFCLGILELAPDGDLALARRRFALVRAAEPDGPLALPALRAERVAADRMGDTDGAADLSDAVTEAARSLRAAGGAQAGWTRRVARYLKRVARG